MLIYILFASAVFFGGFTKQAKHIYKIALVVLFCLTAFRQFDWGGYDSKIYLEFFNRVPELNKLSDFKSDFSIGYVVLNSISKMLSNNYLFFQILLAAITMILLFFIMKRAELSDKQKCFFIFSYFCYRFMWNTWVTYRQNIANLLIWLGILLFWDIEEGKGKISLAVSSIVGGVFHPSSLVNAVLIPVTKISEKISVKKRVIAVEVVSIFLWLYGASTFQTILNFAIKNVDDRFAMYSTSNVGSSNFINFIFRGVLFAWLAITYDKSRYKHKNLAFSTMSVMVVLGSISSELMMRFCEYYAIGMYLALATLIDQFKGKSRMIFGLIFYLVMIIILIRGVFIFGDGVFMDYKSCF